VNRPPSKSSLFPSTNQPELLDTPLPTRSHPKSNENELPQQANKSSSLALTVTKAATQAMDVDDNENPSHPIHEEVEKLDDIVFGTNDEIPSSSNTSVILNNNSYDHNETDIRPEENSPVFDDDDEMDRLPSKKIKRHLDFSLLFDDSISEKNVGSEREKENQQPRRKKQKGPVTPLKMGSDLSAITQSFQFPTSASKKNIVRPSYRPNLKRKQVTYISFTSVLFYFELWCCLE
jgi:hypothetical protein